MGKAEELIAYIKFLNHPELCFSTLTILIENDHHVLATFQAFVRKLQARFRV